MNYELIITTFVCQNDINICENWYIGIYNIRDKEIKIFKKIINDVDNIPFTFLSNLIITEYRNNLIIIIYLNDLSENNKKKMWY